MNTHVLSFILVALLLVALPIISCFAQVQLEWMVSYTSSGMDDDILKDLVVDGQGNVIVTGYTTCADSTRDMLTIKYDPDGNRMWLATYNAPGITSDDAAKDAVVDSAGNVYITGSSGPVQTSRIVTIKYSPTGQELWIYSHVCGCVNSSTKEKLALDAAGNLYVASNIAYENHSLYHLMKLDAEGQPIWEAVYGDTLFGEAEVVDFGMDQYANLYVVGNIGFWPEPGYRICTVKFDSSGNLLWSANYDSQEHPSGVVGSDRVSRMAVATDGSVFVAANGSDALYEPTGHFLFKYSPQGQELWSVRYNFTPNYIDWITSLTLDIEGNLIVGQRSFTPPNTNLCVIVKYDPQGNMLWSTVFDSPHNGSVTPQKITSDTDGNIYVTGSYFYGMSPTMTNFITIKYNSTGELQWFIISDNGADYPETIAMDPDGNVIIAGTSDTYPIIPWIYDRDFVTAKYSQTSNLGSLPDQIPCCFSSLSASPNPFNPTTAISYELRAASFVNLSVYDVSGEKVVELVDGWRDAGAHEVTFDGSNLASGVYLYHLEAGGEGCNGKMVLMK